MKDSLLPQVATVRRLIDRAEYLGEQGRIDEARTHFTRALAMDRTHTAAVAFASFLAHIECYDEALERLRVIANDARRSGDDRLLEVASANIASVCRMRGLIAESGIHHQQSLRAAADGKTATLKSASEVAHDLLNSANNALVDGDTTLANAYVERGLDVLDHPGVCPTETANHFGTLGIIALAEERTADAYQHLKRALRLHQLACDDRGAANDLMNLAEVCRITGSSNESRGYLLRALDEFERLGLAESAERARMALAEPGRILSCPGFDAELN